MRVLRLEIMMKTHSLQNQRSVFQRLSFLSLILTLGIFLNLSSSLYCNDDQEYTVALGGNTELHPTAIISPPSSEIKDVSQEYVQALVGILSFDININGMMSLVDHKEVQKIEKILISSKDFPLAELKSIPLSYLFQCHLQGNAFSISLTSLSDGTTKTYTPIPITGTLSIDRGRIHQLSDFIFHDIFDLSGIASTKILYSKRHTYIDTPKNRTAKSQRSVSTTAEIFLTDYDGGNSKQVTSLKSVSVTPQWIPSTTGKSQSFLFVSYLIGQPKIYIASTKDNKLLRISKMRGNQLTPAVSFDGKKVAFCSDILGSSDLYMLTFDPKIGEISKPRQVYKTPSCATGCPTFSPDGSTIAFVSNKDGSPKIYIMPIPSDKAKLQDLKPKLISKRCRENSAPSWSPDGKKIAYSAKSGKGERQIWVYDVDHDIEYQLTQGAGNKENPSWAPNSAHLVYQGMDPQGKWDIYVINLNQKKPVKITSGSGDNQFPAWEPK